MRLRTRLGVSAIYNKNIVMFSKYKKNSTFIKGNAMEVLLIDDHPMLNAGIVSILEQTGIFKVCAQAQSLKEAMNIIENSETLPSLVILDMLLGEDNGLDFLPMLENFCQNKKIPKPPVLICSVLGDSFKIQTALNSGAAGFLSKTGGKEELLKAIDAILSGKVYISDEVNIKLKKIPLFTRGFPNVKKM